MTQVQVDPMDTDLVEVARFVRLVQDLSIAALEQVQLETLPARDRTYVHRLRILAAEDPNLIQRQRVVWLKLRQGIPLLESEARELLGVLGCRGFYFSGLNLDGMVFGTLDLCGGMIIGDYSCQYTLIRGRCDERNLVVVGRYMAQSRRLEAGVLADGLRVLGHAAGSQTPAEQEALSMGEAARSNEPRSSNWVSSHSSSDDSGVIEELSEDDIINSYAPPPEPLNRHRSARPPFPPPPSATTCSRRSLGPRMGSSRCSRPPRAGVSQSVPRFSAPPQSLLPGSNPTPDTREIDVAWE